MKKIVKLQKLTWILLLGIVCSIPMLFFINNYKNNQNNNLIQSTIQPKQLIDNQINISVNEIITLAKKYPDQNYVILNNLDNYFISELITSSNITLEQTKQKFIQELVNLINLEPQTFIIDAATSNNGDYVENQKLNISIMNGNYSNLVVTGKFLVNDQTNSNTISYQNQTFNIIGFNTNDTSAINQIDIGNFSFDYQNQNVFLKEITTNELFYVWDETNRTNALSTFIQDNFNEIVVNKTIITKFEKINNIYINPDNDESVIVKFKIKNYITNNGVLDENTLDLTTTIIGFKQIPINQNQTSPKTNITTSYLHQNAQNELIRNLLQHYAIDYTQKYGYYYEALKTSFIESITNQPELWLDNPVISNQNPYQLPIFKENGNFNVIASIDNNNDLTIEADILCQTSKQNAIVTDKDYQLLTFNIVAKTTDQASTQFGGTNAASNGSTNLKEPNNIYDVQKLNNYDEDLKNYTYEEIDDYKDSAWFKQNMNNFLSANKNILFNNVLKDNYCKINVNSIKTNNSLVEINFTMSGLYNGSYYDPEKIEIFTISLNNFTTKSIPYVEQSDNTKWIIIGIIIGFGILIIILVIILLITKFKKPKAISDTTYSSWKG